MYALDPPMNAPAPTKAVTSGMLKDVPQDNICASTIAPTALLPEARLPLSFLPRDAKNDISVKLTAVDKENMIIVRGSGDNALINKFV